jgi:hypothetical protein
MQAIYFKGTIIAISTADKNTRVILKQHSCERLQPADFADLFVSGQTYKLKDNYTVKPIYLNQIF